MEIYIFFKIYDHIKAKKAEYKHQIFTTAFILRPLIVIHFISPKRFYMLAWVGYICHLSNILEPRTNLESMFMFKIISSKDNKNLSNALVLPSKFIQNLTFTSLPWFKLLSSLDWAIVIASLMNWFHQNRLGFCRKTFNFPNFSGFPPPKFILPAPSVYYMLARFRGFKEPHSHSGRQADRGCAVQCHQLKL